MATDITHGDGQANSDASLISGIMELLTVPDFYQPLSLRLCKILDSIGASEDIRKLSMETGITIEIMKSCIFKTRYLSCYIFGSQVEGTTTKGLNSDIDFLLSNDFFEIVQCISDIPLELDLGARLIARDKDTKPGYCKLQLVKSRTPITRAHVREQGPDIFQFDSHDRVVQTAVYDHLRDSTKYTAHGPAMSSTATDFNAKYDYVGAYRCRMWPNAASEWLDRIRKYGWPSKNLIWKMKNLGFFVVSVGHPHSSEKDIEWRISLSLQERLLMFSLNPTQFKCYILLKMVKNDGINKKLGEEVITSYHCKTCLFYMIENTPSDLWQPRNLLACLQLCLKYIHKCVTTGNCPNYFNPEENMFEGRMDDKLRIKLENICYNLLTADCSFFLGIQSDDLGKRIISSIFPGTITLDTGVTVNLRVCRYIVRIAAGPMTTKLVLDTFGECTRAEIIREIFRCIDDMSHARPITEHTTEEIRKAACIALPYLELSLLSIVIVGKVELGEVKAAVDLLLSFKWQELCHRSDSFSAKLKQGTFLYMLGQYEACLEVLTPLGSNCTPLLISDCDCKGKMINLPNVFIKENKGISFDDFRANHYVPCTIFSSLEKKHISMALEYEMLRSVYMPSGSWDDFDNNFDADWAVVDGKIYLYFLMFLLTQAIGSPNTMNAINSMEAVLKTDINLSHRETAMNLIGWCHKQNGNIDKAIEYFYASLVLMKSHNAAFWHLLFTLCEMISGWKD